MTANAISTLKNFCAWQYSQNTPDDASPLHYDTAILLTRLRLILAIIILHVVKMLFVVQIGLTNLVNVIKGYWAQTAVCSCKKLVRNPRIV